MRREIERLLDIRAYDIYGLSEIAGPGVACECTEQKGMHVQEDFFFPEIIDPATGEQLPDGEEGELVFTCIGKEALPLIRGVNVFPSQIESVLLDLGMDPNYRMIVDRKNNLDTLEVQVEMNESLFSDTVRNLEKVERTIADALHSTLNIAAKITLLEPKSIQRSEGKAKRVIDKRSL